jgi:hypothetical protein
MGRTFRRGNRRNQSDEWGGVKPKNKKGHKSERAKVRKALRHGDDPTEVE